MVGKVILGLLGLAVLGVLIYIAFVIWTDE
jgi:hypothetical protein